MGASAAGRSGNGASAPLGEALRVQTAAVAAQHAALDEREAQLAQRQGALEQQQEQLAALLDEKRRKLKSLHDRARGERTALRQDRAAYREYLNKVTGDLSQAQRELVEEQQKLHDERRRLARLARRLKNRLAKQTAAEREKIALRAEELANEERNLASERQVLDRRAAAIKDERLSFNGEYELGRRELQEAWDRLRRAQRRWRRRRRGERAALNLRQRELQDAEVALGQAQHALAGEQEQWQDKREALQRDIEGLLQRYKNQRVKLVEQQDQFGSDRPHVPQLPGPDLATASEVVTPSGEAGQHEKLQELNRLAGDLADQRLQLAEQWQRLARTHQRWQQDQARAAAEIETLVQRVHHKEQDLEAREQTQASAATDLRQRHEALIQLHQQLVGWRARLHVREQAWEAERARFLTELKHREELIENHVSALSELRERWTQRRRAEQDKLRDEREAYVRLRQELAVERQRLDKGRTVLDEEKRRLAEKALALEQVRHELLLRAPDSAAAQRRLERLRRRERARHAEAVRALEQDRQAVQSEWTAIQARTVELEARAADLAAAQTELTKNTTAWEHKQVLAQARQVRLEEEMQLALAQRAATEQELAKMKDEVERIASSLLDEPAPTILPLDRAA